MKEAFAPSFIFWLQSVLHFKNYEGESKSITIACNKDLKNVIALQIHVSPYYEKADDHRIIQDIKLFSIDNVLLCTANSWDHVFKNKLSCTSNFWSCLLK